MQSTCIQFVEVIQAFKKKQGAIGALLWVRLGIKDQDCPLPFPANSRNADQHK